MIRQSIRVTPGLVDAETGDAPAGYVFFVPRYDPYDRVVTFELPEGNRWIPSTLYTVWFDLPEDDSTVAGLRALDGESLEEPLSFAFMAGESVTDPAHDVDDTWPRVGFCDGAPDAKMPAPREVLRAACGSVGCHGASSEIAPSMGLDLATPSGIRATAIRVTARQTMTSGAVGPPASNPLVFGDSMPRIDPGNPGNSYLLYKLLIHVSNYPDGLEPEDDTGPWLGALPQDVAVPTEEIRFLRDGFVRGAPMPMSGSLRPAEMRALVAWIGAGAAVDDCADGR